MDREKLKAWLNSRENQILLALIGFAILIRLVYFFKLGAQPIWWDEGDYLAISKVWALNQTTPEWWAHFTGMRPLFIPLIYAALFKIGFSEIIVRFLTQIVPAVLSVYLIYAIGRDMFNKKTGMIAMALFSVNWVIMFYTFRLLTDIPSMFFAILAIYLFWSKYEKPRLEGLEKPSYLWLAVFIGVLAFLSRYIAVLILIVIAVYMLITRNISIFKVKGIWLAIIVGLLALSPLFLYNQINEGSIFPALAVYHGSGSTAQYRPYDWAVLSSDIPVFLGTWTFIFFIIGFILTLEIFLYADILLKQTEKSKNSSLFCFLSIIIPLVYFIFGIRAVDARYFISTTPLMFVLAAYGIEFLSRKIAELTKIGKLALVLIVIITAGIVYTQLAYTDQFINSKANSYLEEKEAGLWLKENTPLDAKIITASIVQNQYYSERQSYDFHTNDTELWKECSDPLTGALSTNETCQTATEMSFNNKIAGIKPDYMILSVFEPVFTPQWAYSYPERYNMTFVKSWSEGDQPFLAIYKFP